MTAAAIAGLTGVAAIDWSAVAASLDERGYAVTGKILPAAACRRIRACYRDTGTAFRTTIDMARHNFGRGQYRYFDYPLPGDVQALREAFYKGLAPIANDWAARLGADANWPDELETQLERCHDAGQRRPTPLLLRYGAGDYNCLHQDRYGDVLFPLQAIVMLSRPGEDFSGGELVLVEQRPRMQSRASVVPLCQGQAAIIPARERPRRGARGYHRARVRHGVSELQAGSRMTLGLIFHDAT